jgi:predicted DNA-binding transcriptional regulator AlpA
LKTIGIVEDRATLRRWMRAQGEDPFPHPIILSGNSVAWVAAEVCAWLDRRPRGSAPQPRRLEAERRATP